MPDGDNIGDAASEATRRLNLLEEMANWQKIADLSSDTRVQQEAMYKIQEARLKLQGKEISNEALALKNRQAAADAWDQTFQNMFGVSDKWKSSTLGKLMQPGGLDGFTDSMKRTFTASNLAVSSLTKAVEITGALVGASLALAKNQDDTLVAFNATTGASKLYGEELLNLESSMNHHGVTLDGASESYTSMSKNVKNLNNMSKTSRVDLAETTAVLNKFGVSADITTANFEFLTAAMGLSSTEANNFSREMFVLAQEIGMPPEEMAKGLQDAAPHIAKFGSQSGEMYKKLAVNARAANMDVSQLLGIVEKFDTFESAAQSVGKLNAILGGPFLNSMEMIQTTDPVERMKLLSDAANQAGASFDDMGYYERIALTEAMGLKDVSELALVMAGGFDQAVPAIKQTQAELANMAKQSADFNTLKEEIAQTWRMFATSLLTWVIPAVKGLLQKFQELNQFFGGYLMPYLGFVAASFLFLVSGIFALVAVLFIASPMVTALAAVTGSVAPAGTAAAGGIAAFTTALTTAAPAIATISTALYGFTPVILAIGAATLMMGGGFLLAAYGMSLFVASFFDLDVAQLLAVSFALVGLGVSLWLLVPALGAFAGAVAAGGWIAVVGLLALGAAALMAGAGISMILNGVVSLMGAIDAETVIQKVASLNSLSLALGSLVISSALMPFVASNLWPLIGALNAIDGEDLIPVANLFESINSMLGGELAGLETVEQTISKIVASINSIDSSEKVFAVKQIIDSIAAATASPRSSAATDQANQTQAAAALNRPILISLNVSGREWASLQTDTLDKLLNQY